MELQKTKMNNDKSFRNLRKLIWIFTGLILSFIFVCIYVSNTGNLKQFYDVGEVYDAYEIEWKYSNDSGWSYDPVTNKNTITNKNSCVILPVNGTERAWNACEIKISELNKKSVPMSMGLLDANNNLLDEQKIELEEGDNLIALKDSKFNKVMFLFPDSEGASFKINYLGLKNKAVDTSGKRLFKLFIVAFAAYLFGSSSFLMIRKKWKSVQIDFYNGIEGLQRVYCKIANICGKTVKNIGIGTRKHVWRGCFLFLITYTIVVYNCGLVTAWWKYTQALYMVIVLIISIFAIDREIIPVNWKNPLVYMWFALWGLVCISDFFVSKRFWGVGYVQIFIWGFCFLIWNNNKNPHKILEAFMEAIIISFVFGNIFCILFWQNIESGKYYGRYCGMFVNPNGFANYLAVVTMVLLNFMVMKFWRDSKKVRCYWECILLDILLVFLWKTQTRGALFTVILLIISMVILFIKRKGGSKFIFKWGSFALVLFFPVYGAVSWGISAVPKKIEAKLVMEAEPLQPVIQDMDNIFANKVYATEKKEDSRIMQTLKRGSLNEISTGRIVIWKSYIRNMNLLGHQSKAISRGKKHDAHNAFLMIAYRYGIFTLIPYVLLWLYIILYGIRNLKNRQENSFLILGLCVSYMFISMIDAEEQPYVNIIWFSMYFVVGMLFQNEKGNESDLISQEDIK